jgi:hypothetical protein
MNNAAIGDPVARYAEVVKSFIGNETRDYSYVDNVNYYNTTSWAAPDVLDACKVDFMNSNYLLKSTLLF